MTVKKKKYVYPKGKYVYPKDKYFTATSQKRELGDKYITHKVEEGKRHGSLKDFIKYKRDTLKKQRGLDET